MRILLIILFFVCHSCVRPVSDYATFGIEEFKGDSQTIHEIESEDCLIEEYADTIVEGDILNVTIYHPKRKDLIVVTAAINNHVGYKVVNECIRLPDIGLIVVCGLTLQEARNQIQMAYQDQLDDIQVYLSYRHRSERKVEIIGTSGSSQVKVDGKMRLYEVLALARVPPHTNLYRSYVVRDEEHLPINLYRLVREGDMTQNIVMRNGDRIFLANAEDSKVMVMGEVRAPQTIGIPNGFISLKEAIGIAGGIRLTGDKSCIQVIRGGVRDPKIYVFSWQELIHTSNDQLLLMAGDMVYITEKPITQWNHFISQTLPTLWNIYSGYNTFNLIP